MNTRKTGLAAFTRSKQAEPQLEASTETTPPASLETSTRRKRGGGETVAMTVKVRRSDWQRLRQLADAEGTTIQAMAEAGFSAVLGQHGLPPLENYSR